MSDATMRAAIKLRLLALGSGMGRVHDYERFATTPADFLKHFQSPANKKIYGWEVVRTGLRVSKVAMAKWRLSHRYMVRGYYVLDDAAATEKTFNGLVDLIVLDLVRTRLAGSERDQLPEAAIETRMFGGIFCHVAEIILPEVSEIVAAVPEEEMEWLRLGLNYYLQDPEDDQVVDASDEITLA